MGRLTGIPYFFTYEAKVDQTADDKQLRKAKAERAEDPEGEEDPVKAAQVEISARLRGEFQNRVIRRIASSKDADGNNLITLPELHIVHCVVKLSDREREILDQITVDGLDE